MLGSTSYWKRYQQLLSGLLSRVLTEPSLARVFIADYCQCAIVRMIVENALLIALSQSNHWVCVPGSLQINHTVH